MATPPWPRAAAAPASDCAAVLSPRSAPQALGYDKDDHKLIKEVLEQQEMVAMQRQWVIREALEGRPLPEAQEEMRIRMRQYPTKWYMKLMRRLQIKSMTFKQRRKMFMYNGKLNKRTKETPKWK